MQGELFPSSILRTAPCTDWNIVHFVQYSPNTINWNCIVGLRTVEYSRCWLNMPGHSQLWMCTVTSCTVDDKYSVDELRILTLGCERWFWSTSRSSMVSVQSYLCKENCFRVRSFGLHLAQIGKLYISYNTIQTTLIKISLLDFVL